jgi:hypothetical protein
MVLKPEIFQSLWPAYRDLPLLGDYAARISEIKKSRRYGSETFWESVNSG